MRTFSIVKSKDTIMQRVLNENWKDDYLKGTYTKACLLDV